MPLYPRQVFISATEPTAKAAGDVWWEINAGTLVPKYDFPWQYDGAYWRSSEQKFEQSINAKTFSPSENLGFFLDARSDVNYFFKELVVNHFSTMAHDANNNLQTVLQRRVTANTATMIGVISTVGNGVNNWTRKNAILNAPVNVLTTNTKLFALYLVANGVTGSNFMTLSATYVYTRA